MDGMDDIDIDGKELIILDLENLAKAVGEIDGGCAGCIGGFLDKLPFEKS